MDCVPQKVWKERMDNLMEKRKAGGIRHQAGIDDYVNHLLLSRDAGYLGEKILDIGAGECKALDALTIVGWKGAYVGIDPFPATPMVMNQMIEDCQDRFLDNYFDTGIAFAVLDGVCDLDAALAQINRVIGGHLLVLTGVNIEPDKWHTHLITLEKLDAGLKDMERVLTNKLHPKVYFLVYKKNLQKAAE